LSEGGGASVRASHRPNRFCRLTPARQQPRPTKRIPPPATLKDFVPRDGFFDPLTPALSPFRGARGAKILGKGVSPHFL